MGDGPLERRELFRLAAAAAAMGAQAGCAPGQRPAPASPPDMASRLDPAAAEALLAKIDERMAWIDRASLPDDVLPMSKMPRNAAAEAELARTGPLVRKAIRTLYFTGRFLDMPDEMKVHPGVQARLRAMQPEMDDAVLGMTERLEHMTPENYRRMQEHLRDDSGFGDRLAQVLERTATDDGLSFQRSFGVRSATLQLTERMSAQSPALVADPLVSKVRRIEAHPRPDAEETRRLAARVGEEAFWQHQDRLAVLHEAWMIRLGTAQAANAATTAASVPSTPAPSSPGKNTVSAGGYIMGFGLGSVALGLIFAGIYAATQSIPIGITALVLGVTIGPILLVVGLIVVIVGAIIRAYE